MEAKKNISIYHPKTPGNYRAQLKDSFNVKGLITSATIVTENCLSLADIVNHCSIHLFVL
jgi:hypothetical protein